MENIDTSEIPIHGKPDGKKEVDIFPFFIEVMKNFTNRTDAEQIPQQEDAKKIVTNIIRRLDAQQELLEEMILENQIIRKNLLKLI